LAPNRLSEIWSLDLDVGTSILAQRVIRMMRWLIELRFIEPDKPSQIAFTERFDKKNWDEVLYAYVFGTMAQVHDIAESLLREY
jgi:hypothetical protein